MVWKISNFWILGSGNIKSRDIKIWKLFYFVIDLLDLTLLCANSFFTQTYFDQFNFIPQCGDPHLKEGERGKNSNAVNIGNNCKM